MCTLVASPPAKGLFRAAIAESGPCTGPWSPLNATYGLQAAKAVLAMHNATDLNDLRKVPAEAVASWPDAYSGDIHFNAYFVDGHVHITHKDLPAVTS